MLEEFFHLFVPLYWKGMDNFILKHGIFSVRSFSESLIKSIPIFFSPSGEWLSFNCGEFVKRGMRVLDWRLMSKEASNFLDDTSYIMWCVVAQGIWFYIVSACFIWNRSSLNWLFIFCLGVGFHWISLAPFKTWQIVPHVFRFCVCGRRGKTYFLVDQSWSYKAYR